MRPILRTSPSVATCKTHPRKLGHSLVIRIRDNKKQLLDTIASDRSHDPELGKMSPNRIGRRGQLADEQLARAMEHQAALLRGSFGWHEPQSQDVATSRPLRLSLDHPEYCAGAMR